MTRTVSRTETSDEATPEGGRTGQEGAKSRRDPFRALGTAAAGALAAGTFGPTEALAHGSFHRDSNNANPAIHGNNSADGPGVEGTAISGPGVRGSSDGGPGVAAGSISGPGVLGSSDGGTGVRGHSHGGPGLHGDSDFGPGVLGISSSGTGVVAENSFEGDALHVKGAVRFTTAGAAAVPAGQSSSFVSNAAVTGASHITVMLTGNPGTPAAGPPATVVWVARQPGTGFVLHLSRRVGPATPFTYLIVEPFA